MGQSTVEPGDATRATPRIHHVSIGPTTGSQTWNAFHLFESGLRHCGRDAGKNCRQTVGNTDYRASFRTVENAISRIRSTWDNGQGGAALGTHSPWKQYYATSKPQSARNRPGRHGALFP